MANPVRFALVGAGKVAILHALALNGQRGARVAAVCDPVLPRAEALAATSSALVCSLEDALADPAIDAVILATPSELHAAQVRSCLAAGKHVLCEFPLYCKPMQLDRLEALALKRGVCLMVAHTTHYLPPYVKAKQWLERGEIGAVHTLLYRRRLFRPGGIAPDRDWRDNALTHLGGHVLDLIPWLLHDRPLHLAVTAQPSAQEATIVGVLMGMTGGAISAFSIDFESRPNSIWMEVAGSAGTLTVSGFSRLEINGRVRWQAADDDAPYRAAIAAQDRDFVKAILGGVASIT
jgi:2-hydroxy-4-carboxymuconate semialdehyde hemiacetal dehydrogenase